MKDHIQEFPPDAPIFRLRQSGTLYVGQGPSPMNLLGGYKIIVLEYDAETDCMFSADCSEVDPLTPAAWEMFEVCGGNRHYVF